MTRDESDIWFPAKRYGWGWAPPRAWQGWVAIGLYLVMLAIGVTGIDPERQTALFFTWLGGWSMALFVVCYLKGERPRWRWGSRR